MTSQFDEDYYLRGPETGKSLYSNYTWMPGLTMTMVRMLALHLGLVKGDSVLDVGCSRGYIVRALMEQGFESIGVDVSSWAIAHCDENVRDRLRLISPCEQLPQCDWIISKDTLEHVPEEDIVETIRSLTIARKGVFIVVPLSENIDQPYVVPDYEKDITHEIRWPLLAWVQAIEATFGPGWSIQFQYRLEGCKDNYAQWAKGNGFITIRRLPRLQKEQW